MRLVFDIEADGLYQEVTQMWCIVTKDIDSGEVRQFYEENLLQGIHHLRSASLLIGHNIINYDVAALRKLHDFEYSGELFDTLVVSRLLNPDRYGGHSLDAWGQKLGRQKPKHEDWSKFSPEMLHRCEQDVLINEMVYYELLKEISDG